MVLYEAQNENHQIGLRSRDGHSMRHTSRRPATLKELVRVQDNSVTFTATFGGKQLTYDYGVAYSKVAKNLAEVLVRNSDAFRAAEADA